MERPSPPIILPVAELTWTLGHYYSFIRHHKYTMEELIENAIKPHFEEGYGP